MSTREDKEVFESAREFVRLIKASGCDLVRVDVDGKNWEVSATPMEFVKKGMTCDEFLAKIRESKGG